MLVLVQQLTLKDDTYTFTDIDFKKWVGFFLQYKNVCNNINRHLCFRCIIIHMKVHHAFTVGPISLNGPVQILKVRE